MVRFIKKVNNSTDIISTINPVDKSVAYKALVLVALNVVIGIFSNKSAIVAVLQLVKITVALVISAILVTTK